jgi:hypothetical protein
LTDQHNHSPHQPGSTNGHAEASGAAPAEGYGADGVPVVGEYPGYGYDADDSGVVLRTTRYRRRGKRRWILWLLAPLLLIAGTVISGLFYLDNRLAKGPVEWPSLGQRIAASLSERAGKGYRFVIGKTSLQKNAGRAAITLDSMQVFGADGRVILSAPNAVVSLDWLALMSGAVRPRRLAVSGLDLHVSVAADGSLSVSAGRTRLNLTGSTMAEAAELRGTTPPAQGKPTVQGMPPARGASAASLPPPAEKARVEGAGQIMASALTRLFELAAADASQLRSLRHIGISGGRLIFNDKTRNRETVFRGLDMEIGRSADELRFTLSAVGAAGRWKIQTSAERGDNYDIKVEARNLTLDDIALIGGLRNLAVDFDGRFDGAVRMSLSPSGAIGKAQGRFSAGKGMFLARDKDFEPLMVDRLAGTLRWDHATNAVLVEDVEYRSGLNAATLSGRIEPPAKDAAEWRMTLETRGAVTAADQQKPESSLPLQKLRMALLLDPASKVLTIERLALQGQGLNLLVSARFAYAEGARRLQLTGQLDPVSVDTALSLWPAALAPPARVWSMQNLSGGTVQELKVRLDFDESHFIAMASDRPLPETASDIRYRLSGISLRYLAGTAPLTQVTVTGTTRGSVTRVAFARGVADVGKGRKLRISGGQLNLRGKARDYAEADLNLRVAGTMDSVNALLRQSGFKKYVPADMSLSDMSGKMDATLDLKFAVSRNLSVPAPVIAGRFKLSGVRMQNFAGSAPLENASLDVTLADGALSARGTGRLFAAPAQLKMHKRPGSPVQGAISLVLDDAAREKMGWETGNAVSGPIAVKLSGALTAAADMRADVTLDMTKARLTDLVPGYRKPPGRAASASFKLMEQRDGLVLNDFRFRSQDLSARGVIRLGKNNSFRSARLTELKLSPGDDLRADISKAGEGLKVALTGPAIDLRPIISGRMSEASSGPARKLTLSINTGIATGYNGQVLSAFRVNMEKDKSGISRFSLKARAGKAPVQGQLLRRSAEVPVVSIDSSDAGTILSFLNVYSRMERGRMRLTARLAGDGIDGALDVRSFLLRNEPALRQLVAQGAPNTAADTARRIDASAVPFQRLQFGFRRDSTRLLIRDGIISGPEIGLTLSGAIDFGADRVALKGTFVPAYGLNNAFAKVPLFGPLLAGGRNEGLLGVNFAVSGTVARPVLNINPLSAIAPGFLRKIFGALPARQ